MILQTQHYCNKVALAEWLRRVPAKYMGFPRESSNLSGDDLLTFSPLIFPPTSHAQPSFFLLLRARSPFCRPALSKSLCMHQDSPHSPVAADKDDKIKKKGF